MSRVNKRRRLRHLTDVAKVATGPDPGLDWDLLAQIGEDDWEPMPHDWAFCPCCGGELTEITSSVPAALDTDDRQRSAP